MERINIYSKYLDNTEFNEGIQFLVGSFKEKCKGIIIGDDTIPLIDINKENFCDHNYSNIEIKVQSLIGNLSEIYIGTFFQNYIQENSENLFSDKTKDLVNSMKFGSGLHNANKKNIKEAGIKMVEMELLEEETVWLVYNILSENKKNEKIIKELKKYYNYLNKNIDDDSMINGLKYGKLADYINGIYNKEKQTFIESIINYIKTIYRYSDIFISNCDMIDKEYIYSLKYEEYNSFELLIIIGLISDSNYFSEEDSNMFNTITEALVYDFIFTYARDKSDSDIKEAIKYMQYGFMQHLSISDINKSEIVSEKSKILNKEGFLKKYGISIDDNISNNKIDSLLKSELGERIDKIKDKNKKKYIIQIALSHPKFINNDLLEYKNTAEYIFNEENINKVEGYKNYLLSQKNKQYDDDSMLFVLKKEIYEYQIINYSNLIEGFKKISDIGIFHNDFLLLNEKEGILTINTIKKNIKIIKENQLTENYDILNFLKVLYLRDKVKNDTLFLLETNIGFLEIKKFLSDDKNLNHGYLEYESILLKLYKKFTIEEIIQKNKKVIGNKDQNIFIYILNELKYNLSKNKINQREINKIINNIFLKKDDEIIFINEIFNLLNINQQTFSEIDEYIQILLKNHNHIKLIDLSKFDTITDLIVFLDKNNIKSYIDNELKIIYGEDLEELYIDQPILNKKVLIKIGNTLNIDLIEEFIFQIDINISLIELENINLLLNFSNYYNLGFDLNYIFSLNLKTIDISYIENNYSNFNINNVNLYDFLNSFKEYILGNQSVLEEYIKTIKDNQDSIIISNKFDNFVKNIDDNKKISDIYNTLISKILSEFTPAKLSSTDNNKSGYGSGSNVRKLDNFLIELLQKKDETDCSYIERVSIVNWKNIINLNTNEVRGSRLLNIINAFDDINYTFIEALINFSNVFKKIEVGQFENLDNVYKVYNKVLSDELNKLEQKIGEDK